jgi:hypothetical protein
VSRNTPECGFQIPYYSLRSTVRPGITGWAQVRYRYANNLGEEIEKLRFDLYYVKHYSILLDLRILLETISVVVFGREYATEKDPKEMQEITVAPEEVADRRPKLTAIAGGDVAATRYQTAKRALPRSNG